MKKVLVRQETECWYFVDGKRIVGCHDKIRGNVTGIRGDVTGLRGYVTGLSGDVSGLSGYVTGLSGNVSGLSGDVDECEIEDEEREKGIDINDLIKI